MYRVCRTGDKAKLSRPDRARAVILREPKATEGSRDRRRVTPARDPSVALGSLGMTSLGTAGDSLRHRRRLGEAAAVVLAAEEVVGRVDHAAAVDVGEDRVAGRERAVLRRRGADQAAVVHVVDYVDDAVAVGVAGQDVHAESEVAAGRAVAAGEGV